MQKWTLTLYILSYSLLFVVPSLLIFKFVNILSVRKGQKAWVGVLLFMVYLYYIISLLIDSAYEDKSSLHYFDLSLSQIIHILSKIYKP